MRKTDFCIKVGMLSIESRVWNPPASAAHLCVTTEQIFATEKKPSHIAIVKWKRWCFVVSTLHARQSGISIFRTTTSSNSKILWVRVRMENKRADALLPFLVRVKNGSQWVLYTRCHCQFGALKVALWLDWWAFYCERKVEIASSDACGRSYFVQI